MTLFSIASSALNQITAHLNQAINTNTVKDMEWDQANPCPVEKNSCFHNSPVDCDLRLAQSELKAVTEGQEMLDAFKIPLSIMEIESCETRIVTKMFGVRAEVTVKLTNAD